MKRVRIAVIDDHHVVFDAICLRLIGSNEFEVIAYAAGWQQFESQSNLANIDLVVLDLEYPGQKTSGVDIARSIMKANHEVHIVVYSSLLVEAKAKERDWIMQSLSEIGVKGFVSKTYGVEVLLQAIYSVCNGKIFYSNDLECFNSRERAKIDTQPSFVLAPRLLENARYFFVLGLSPKEVQRLTKLGKTTIKTYKTIAMAQIGQYLEMSGKVKNWGAIGRETKFILAKELLVEMESKGSK